MVLLHRECDDELSPEEVQALMEINMKLVEINQQLKRMEASASQLTTSMAMSHEDFERRMSNLEKKFGYTWCPQPTPMKPPPTSDLERSVIYSSKRSLEDESKTKLVTDLEDEEKTMEKSVMKLSSPVLKSVDNHQVSEALNLEVTLSDSLVVEYGFAASSHVSSRTLSLCLPTVCENAPKTIISDFYPVSCCSDDINWPCGGLNQFTSPWFEEPPPMPPDIFSFISIHHCLLNESREFAPRHASNIPISWIIIKKNKDMQAKNEITAYLDVGTSSCVTNEEVGLQFLWFLFVTKVKWSWPGLNKNFEHCFMSKFVCLCHANLVKEGSHNREGTPQKCWCIIPLEDQFLCQYICVHDVEKIKGLEPANLGLEFPICDFELRFVVSSFCYRSLENVCFMFFVCNFNTWKLQAKRSSARDKYGLLNYVYLGLSHRLVLIPNAKEMSFEEEADKCFWFPAQAKGTFPTTLNIIRRMFSYNEKLSIQCAYNKLQQVHIWAIYVDDLCLLLVWVAWSLTHEISGVDW